MTKEQRLTDRLMQVIMSELIDAGIRPALPIIEKLHDRILQVIERESQDRGSDPTD